MRLVLTDIRFLPALVVGGIVALGLFLLMHRLISNNQQATNVAQPMTLVNFVQVERTPPLERKNYNMPKPPPPPKNPPPRQQVTTTTQANVQEQTLPVAVKFDTSSIGSGSGVYIGNAAPATNAGGYAPLTPMVRIKPLYPPQAQYQGVTGDVYVCFTVNPDGSVSNPYVRRASTPQARQLLGEAALRTILQWKFFPQKVNGNPVATNNVCQNIHFTIGKNAQNG